LHITLKIKVQYSIGIAETGQLKDFELTLIYRKKRQT